MRKLLTLLTAELTTFSAAAQEMPTEEGMYAYKLFGEVGIVLLLLLAFTLYWNYRLKQYNTELARASRTDSLTGLHNRMSIDELFQQEFERAYRYQRPFSVIMLDIDYFKKINDESGHLVGDKVLVQIASTIAETVRNTDFIGRWGGDEFVVLCPETTLDAAEIVGNRLCSKVRDDEYADSRPHSISIGIAQLTLPESMDRLLNRADTALYKAKAAGHDQVFIDRL